MSLLARTRSRKRKSPERLALGPYYQSVGAARVEHRGRLTGHQQQNVLLRIYPYRLAARIDYVRLRYPVVVQLTAGRLQQNLGSCVQGVEEMKVCVAVCGDDAGEKGHLPNAPTGRRAV